MALNGVPCRGAAQSRSVADRYTEPRLVVLPSRGGKPVIICSTVGLGVSTVPDLDSRCVRRDDCRLLEPL